MRIDNGELDVANSSDVRYVGRELQSYRSKQNLYRNGSRSNGDGPNRGECPK